MPERWKKPSTRSTSTTPANATRPSLTSSNRGEVPCARTRSPASIVSLACRRPPPLRRRGLARDRAAAESSVSTDVPGMAARPAGDASRARHGPRGSTVMSADPRGSPRQRPGRGGDTRIVRDHRRRDRHRGTGSEVGCSRSGVAGTLPRRPDFHGSGDDHRSRPGRHAGRHGARPSRRLFTTEPRCIEPGDGC